MSVEEIGPDYSVPLYPSYPSHPSRDYQILSYEEVLSIHTNKHKIELNKTRDINDITETKKLVPLDIHKAVIDKIQNDANTYATSKSTSQTMLNISVIQTQIFQLVNTIQGGMNVWNIILIVLLSNSLILEFIIFVLLVLLAKSKTEQITKYCTATPLNSLVTTLSGLLLIITTTITIISKSVPTIGMNVTNF